MPLPGWRSFSGFLSVVLLAGLAGAQQSASPPPTPRLLVPAEPVASVASDRAPAHLFWDRKNALLFGGVGAFRALDYTSTRNMRDRGRQEILLTNSAVDNRPLFVGIEAAATGLSIGLSYVMHRTGHHKVERLISVGHISGAAFGDARNYALKSGRH